MTSSRGVHVALSTGYTRVEGNRRASLNGRVSPPPPNEIPHDFDSNLCARRCTALQCLGGGLAYHVHEHGARLERPDAPLWALFSIRNLCAVGALHCSAWVGGSRTMSTSTARALSDLMLPRPSPTGRLCGGSKRESTLRKKDDSASSYLRWRSVGLR